MALDSYLFEKARDVPGGLARVAEDLRLLAPGSLAAREIGAYLNVALRHGLSTCCAISGADFEGGWASDLSREGGAAWRRVLSALEDAFFGPTNETRESRPRGCLATTHPAPSPVKSPSRR